MTRYFHDTKNLAWAIFLNFSKTEPQYSYKQYSEAAIQWCTWEKVCWKYEAKTYRRTPMPKCGFNKVAKQLYWNSTSAWGFSCKFAAYFQNTFSTEHLWMATSGKTSSSLFWCLYFELWLYFTHCPGVFLVDFEQVSAGWVMNLIT